MDNELQKSRCLTRQSRIVFPRHLNSTGTFFGGEAMQWLDEVAFITATRYSRQRMVTVKAENIRFLKPVVSDTILELVGSVVKTSQVRLFINVEVFAESLYSDHREKVLDADFVFVPCNDELHPVALKNPE